MRYSCTLLHRAAIEDTSCIDVLWFSISNCHPDLLIFTFSLKALIEIPSSKPRPTYVERTKIVYESGNLNLHGISLISFKTAL
jgi:hypothetical protein